MSSKKYQLFNNAYFDAVQNKINSRLRFTQPPISRKGMSQVAVFKAVMSSKWNIPGMEMFKVGNVGTGHLKISILNVQKWSSSKSVLKKRSAVKH